MLKAIFWKEWRQQGPFLIAILFLMPISVGLLLWLGGSFPSERTPIADKLTMLALGIAILQAMVTGSVLFAGEVETGTLDFLDACSAERSRIWVAKMASALAIVLPAALLPALFGGLHGLLWMVCALETLLVAAACSVFVRTPFRALGAAVLCLFVMSGVAYLTSESAVGTCGLSLVIAGFVVFESWLRFCRPDRERRADPARTLPSTWLTGSLWFLVRRQWRMLLLVGIVLVVYLGWILATSHLRMQHGIAAAPALLFAVGCMCGWSVFALEQAGAERFLGDQRLPRNRLWLAKIGGWLLSTMIAVTVVAFFTVIITFETGSENIFDDWAMRMFARELALGLLGFSAAQFFGIHHRRLPVVLFLTLLIATPIGAAWYAPLFGGEPAWHFAVVPLLFLAASRFELRRWMAGRLDGVAHWVRCGLVALGGFALTGLILWHRTAEVPDVGAPFVFAESRIETEAERERSKRIAVPAEEASRRFHQLRLGGDENHGASHWDLARWHEPGIDLGPESATDLQALYDQVLALGAPDEGRDDYARLMAEALAGDWPAKLRKELVDDPRRVSVLGSRENYQIANALNRAAEIFCMNAALLVAEGKSDAAADEFALSLAIVRHRYLYGSARGSLGAFGA
ncbi:MAG TPA: hypothetical protein VHR72_02990, partial [Gemmataceae bacterium]|nr:hypothetical protein [Gemmataceae bacterium]